MRNFALLIISVLIFASCSNNSSDNKQKNFEGKEVLARYTNGSAQIEREFKMIDGKRLAVYEWEYYEDGNILKEGPLSKNEKRDGIWKAYYRDGSLWSEGEYNDGIRHGNTKTYHENGKLYYDGKFNNAQKTGIWKFYDKDGNFDYEIDYDSRAKAKITIDSTKIKK
jgi:antitoxin component YwqK of YwqJK toxin-antitoxin module